MNSAPTLGCPKKFKVQNILLSLDQKFHLDLLTLTKNCHACN